MIMWHFSKRIANLVDKRLIRVYRLFACDMLLQNSRQLVHTSAALSEKKRGNYVGLTNVNQSTTNRTPNGALKVKLYPGFQESVEEVYSKQTLDEPTDDQFAKKIIEDFYGLDKLEYDEEKDAQIDQQKRQLAFPNDQLDLYFLVSLLRNENVQDICCIEIPEEMNYADHMIIGTCLSVKHLNSVFETVNKSFKQVRGDTDTGYLRRKAGKESKWCAIDIGQFVIHLFLEEYRSYYDLESLWSCGIEFDDKYQQFFKTVSDFERKLLVNEDELGK